MLSSCLTKADHYDILVESNFLKQCLHKERTAAMFLRTMKDMADELRGIDVDARYREKREARKKELEEYKENNFISRTAKRYITIIGVLFLLYGFVYAYLYFGKGRILLGIVTVIQIMLALAGMIMVRIENKSIQKIGGGLFLAFILIQLALTFAVFQ